MENLDLNNKYANLELFQKEAIASISLDIKLKNLKFVLKGKTTYYDFLTAEHFFSIFENEPGYSRLILEGKDIGLKFNKKEDIYWVRFFGETLFNEEIRKILQNRNLREIEKGMIFPLILNKNGRLFYLFQYSNDVIADASADLIYIMNAYNETYGPGTFKIEKISNAESFLNYFTYGDFEQIFYQLNLNLPYEGPDFVSILKRLSMKPEEYEFLIKINNEYKTMKFPEVLKLLKIDPGTYLNIISILPENFVFMSYFDGICKNNICTIKLILEERFIPFLLNVLNKLKNAGIEFSIENLIKLNLTKMQKVDVKNLFSPVNKDFFNREITYSKDLNYFGEIKDLIDSAICYSDDISFDKFLIINKDDPNFAEIKYKALKNNIKINENKFYLWFSFPETSKIYKEIKDVMNEGRMIQSIGVYHFPFSISYKGRMYYKIQYASESEYDATRRLLKIIDAQSKLIGKDAIKIEEIGNITDPISFINQYGIKDKIVYLELVTDYNKNIKGLVKNSSTDINHIQILYDEGNGLKLTNFSDIQKRTIGDLTKEFFKNLIDNLSFFLHIDFRCENGKCLFNFLIEEKMLPVVSSSLAGLIDSGTKVKISRFIIF
ncbi:MAG: hypothetical protein ACP5R3_00010 [Thermoplasmata archaeon]